MIRVELPALIGRLNDISRQALEASAALCISRQGAEITPAHLLFKLLETPFSDVRQILEHTGINHQQLQPVVGDSLNGEPQTAEPYPSFSPLLVELMQDAWLLASTELGHTELRSGAVFLALLMNADRYLMPRVAQALVDINREQLRKQFDRVTEGSVERPQLTESGGAKRAVEADMDPLKRYATDFTKLAREDKLDPVVCRDAEIDQMIDILCRRRKNNPIVVGDAGVGKSAVVEGLALRIVNGDVPDRLKNVELWTLDMGALQAGASVKGEFEKRLKGVIEAVKGSAIPIILFIDEAHTLIGAGNNEGGSDAANLLKPALARGELRTIAATTWREYKKYFEKDPALSRRFQPVALDEPTPGEAVHILRGLRTVYEKAHQVLIADSALKAAAEMSARYLAGRQLPDKAIDVLDTACARVSLNLSTPPRRLSHVRSELHQLAMEQELLSREHTLGQNVDAEREQAEARQRTAREQVEQPEQVAALLVEEVLQRDRVHARHRDEGADAEHDKRAYQEQEPGAKLSESARRFRQVCRILLGLLCHVSSVRFAFVVALFDAAAGLFDGRARTLGHGDALQLDRLVQFARQDDLYLGRERRNEVRGLQHVHVDHVGRRDGELVQPQFRGVLRHLRAEADLRQASLQRHLAAFEADLRVAAGTGVLALHTTAGRLALARGVAAANALADFLGALAG